MGKILNLLLALLMVAPATASVNWDGPVDAAIDQLALTLQGLGFTGAGVRPFGYGFSIEHIVDEQPQVEIPDSVLNPNPEGALNANVGGGNTGDKEEGSVEIPDEVWGGVRRN